ncbi:MAG: YcxB family protein [Halioglobus sp.]
MTDADASTEHSSYYVLNRDYFSECFDESANTTTSVKTYVKAIGLIFMASVIYAMDIEIYVAAFLLCLGVVELLSIRYKRSWWINRQMLSGAAGSKVVVRVNDQGIFTDSTYHQQGMHWGDIDEIKGTEKGFLVKHNSGTSYLSKSGLDEEALVLLTGKTDS